MLLNICLKSRKNLYCTQQSLAVGLFGLCFQACLHLTGKGYKLLALRCIHAKQNIPHMFHKFGNKNTDIFPLALKLPALFQHFGNIRDKQRIGEIKNKTAVGNSQHAHGIIQRYSAAAVGKADIGQRKRVTHTAAGAFGYQLNSRCLKLGAALLQHIFQSLRNHF